VLAGLLLAGQALALSEVVHRVFLGGQPRSALLSLFLLLLAMAFCRAGLLWLLEVAAQRAAGLLKFDMRDRLTRHLLRLGPAYTQTQRSGELVNAAVSGVEALDGYVAQFLPARSMAVVTPTLIFLLVLLIDPWTTLVLLFAGPMLILLLGLIGGRTRVLTTRRFAEMSWMSAFFLDILQGLTTLKLFGRSREQVDNIRAVSRQFGSTTMEVLATAFQTSLVMEWAATAATALVALEVSLRLMNDLLPFNQALAVLLLTPEFFMPLRQLALQYHAGAQGREAAGRLFAILDEPLPAGPAPLAAPATLRQPASLPGDIHFQDVYVSYDNGERPALSGVTLTIPRGAAVALVGATGAGKSTVAHLLLRFVEPAAGLITIGDARLSDLEPEAWRKQISWVSQNPHFFHGSVADNLRLARPEATRADLLAAAEVACADDFIRRLPAGYDTHIGEQGLRLSGGQRQRLAIARAFLRDAPLLILDEATANLDPAGDADVRAALSRLIQGRTSLIIAHRLHMAYAADEIIVLDAGRIVARGRHADLLAGDEHYRRLVAAYEEYER
jgi:thiol reductant ABC exporter CydD subunit